MPTAASLLSVFPLCLQLHQFAAVRDTTVVRSVLEQAMAQTRTNIAWLRDNYDTIRDWLANRGATLPPPAAGSYRFGSQFLLFCFVVWYGPNFKHWFTTSFLQPLTTSYAIGSRKLSANEQFFVGAQTVVSLLQTTKIISDICFITDHVAYASSDKTKIV